MCRSPLQVEREVRSWTNWANGHVARMGTQRPSAFQVRVVIDAQALSKESPPPQGATHCRDEPKESSRVPQCDLLLLKGPPHSCGTVVLPPPSFSNSLPPIPSLLFFPVPRFFPLLSLSRSIPIRPERTTGTALSQPHSRTTSTAPPPPTPSYPQPDSFYRGSSAHHPTPPHSSPFPLHPSLSQDTRIQAAQLLYPLLSFSCLIAVPWCLSVFSKHPLQLKRVNNHHGRIWRRWPRRELQLDSCPRQAGPQGALSVCDRSSLLP